MTKIQIADRKAYNKGYLVYKEIELPCTNLDEVIAEVLANGMDIAKSTDHTEVFISSIWCDEEQNIYKLNERFKDEL